MLGTYMPFPDARDYLEKYHHQPSIHITKMTHQGHHSVFSHLHHEKSTEAQSHDKAADDQTYNQTYDEAFRLSKEPEMTENHEGKSERRHSLFHLHHEAKPKTDVDDEALKEGETTASETHEAQPERRHSLFHLPSHHGKSNNDTSEVDPDASAELDLCRSEKHTPDNPHWHHALFHRTQSGRHVEKSAISPPISPIESSTSSFPLDPK